MNSALRARRLACSEVISKYYSPSSSQKDKIAHQESALVSVHFSVYWQKLINIYFCVVYTKTIIHPASKNVVDIYLYFDDYVLTIRLILFLSMKIVLHWPALLLSQ